MNREIKFRAWDKERGMQEMTGIKLPNTTDPNRHLGVAIMQYTGLKDKNGKEIYEGDIVKVGDDLIEEVKWIKEKEWALGECPFSGFVNHSAVYKTGVKIIGNIYENPELIK